MFNNSNLSFEQAPPIKVVLRFFLTGALFGVVAFLFAIFNANSFVNIGDSATLTFVHLLTLGIMASFMFGALFQMMPVLAGVSINSSELLSMRVHYGLIFGLLFLISSFYSGADILYFFAALFLGYSLFAAAYTILKELLKVQKSASPKGMMLALLSLVAVAILGILMLAIRYGADLPLNYIDIKNAHLGFGLFGWIAMLIIAVAFQVIEMFYVTPPYPKVVTKYLTVAIFVFNIVTLISPASTIYMQSLIALALGTFALFTLVRLSQKKRAVSDATIWFWRSALISLVISALLLITGNFMDINLALIATFYTIFALSVVYAMVFKIVPFLVWFQLNRAGYFDAPMMHEVIHPKSAKYNFYIFIAASMLSIIGINISFVAYIGYLLMTISFLMLAILIYKAWHKYLHTLQFGTKLDFSFNI
jgi:hypothetical protein